MHGCQWTWGLGKTRIFPDQKKHFPVKSGCHAVWYYAAIIGDESVGGKEIACKPLQRSHVTSPESVLTVHWKTTLLQNYQDLG